MWPRGQQNKDYIYTYNNEALEHAIEETHLNPFGNNTTYEQVQCPTCLAIL